MKSNIYLAAALIAIGVSLAACSQHTTNSLPPTIADASGQPTGARHTMDTTDGNCPDGYTLDSEGNCLQTIATVTATPSPCDYDCQASQNPCVQNPGMCTGPPGAPGTGGGGAAPTPTPTPTPACNQTGTAALDAIINGSSPLKKAMTAMSNAGHKPDISIDNTLVAGHAAETNTTTGAIKYSTTNAANAGQPQEQILFHEIDHDFYVTVSPQTLSGTATVTLANGDVITYDLSNADADDAYTHVFVHNDTYGAFGAAGDQTGAIWSAFGIADVNNMTYDGGVSVKDKNGNTITGSDLKTLADGNRSTRLDESVKPTSTLNDAMTNSGTTCNPAAAASSLHPLFFQKPVLPSQTWSPEIYEIVQ